MKKLVKSLHNIIVKNALINYISLFPVSLQDNEINFDTISALPCRIFLLFG